MIQEVVRNVLMCKNLLRLQKMMMCNTWRQCFAISSILSLEIFVDASNSRTTHRSLLFDVSIRNSLRKHWCYFKSTSRLYHFWFCHQISTKSKYLISRFQLRQNICNRSKKFRKIRFWHISHILYYTKVSFI